MTQRIRVDLRMRELINDSLRRWFTVSNYLDDRLILDVCSDCKEIMSW